MTRVRYETAADRERELAAGERFAAAANATIVKLPDGACADFEVWRKGKHVGTIEIKTRTCASTDHTTYHVSKAKLKALKALATNSVMVALVVQWTDRCGYIGVSKFLANATYSQGGRTDRGDSFDVETMAAVPVDLFTFLPEVTP